MNDDHATAKVFHALSQPAALQLLLDALEPGQHEIEVCRPREAEHSAMLRRLATLVDAGLMTCAPGGDGEPDVYRLTDTAALERLISAARQLNGDGAPDR